MTIKYTIRVRWIPDEGIYQGEVGFGLPCEEDSWYLDSMLRSSSCEVLDWKLIYNWGEHNKGYRWRSKIVAESETSAEVARQCRLHTEEVLARIHEVVRRNREGFSHEQYIEEEVNI